MSIGSFFRTRRRRDEMRLRAAWDTLSELLIHDGDRRGVCGVSYRNDPPRLIVYSDDVLKSASVVPAAVDAYEVLLMRASKAR